MPAVPAAAPVQPPLDGVKPYKSLSNDELRGRIDAVRAELGDRLLILGHHYQQDEVIELADLRGDSYQLSQMAAGSDAFRSALARTESRLIPIVSSLSRE